MRCSISKPIVKLGHLRSKSTVNLAHDYSRLKSKNFKLGLLASDTRKQSKVDFLQHNVRCLYHTSVMICCRLLRIYNVKAVSIVHSILSTSLKKFNYEAASPEQIALGLVAPLWRRLGSSDEVTDDGRRIVTTLPGHLWNRAHVQWLLWCGRHCGRSWRANVRSSIAFECTRVPPPAESGRFPHVRQTLIVRVDVRTHFCSSFRIVGVFRIETGEKPRKTNPFIPVHVPVKREGLVFIRFFTKRSNSLREHTDDNSTVTVVQSSRSSPMIVTERQRGDRKGW